MSHKLVPNEPRPAVEDPIGISAWASALDVDPANVLAMAAGILSGIAAPSAVLRFPWGEVEVPKLHLIAPATEGVLPQALAFLLKYPCAVNRMILATMAGIHPAELRHALHGTFASKPTKPDPDGFTESSNVCRILRYLGLGPGDKALRSSEEDLDSDPRTARIEGIFRPAILLESPALKDIPELLSGCHEFHALAVGLRFEPLLASARRKSEIEGLMRFFWGTEIVIPPSRHPTGIESHRPAGIQAIFQADTDLLHLLFSDIAPLVADSLLLSDGAAPDGIESGENGFIERWTTSAFRIATSRRDGKYNLGQFSSEAAAHRFQKLNREYLRACDSGAEKVGCSVRNLPLSLVWSLLMLRVGLKSWDAPDDDSIITSVFSAAKTLLQRHCRKLEDLGLKVALDETVRRAQRIVFKVEAKKEVTFTQLVRSFDIQKTSLYRPLVDVLVGENVLARRPDGRLVIGGKSFDEMNRTPLLEAFHDSNA